MTLLPIYRVQAVKLPKSLTWHDLDASTSFEELEFWRGFINGQAWPLIAEDIATLVEVGEIDGNEATAVRTHVDASRLAEKLRQGRRFELVTPNETECIDQAKACAILRLGKVAGFLRHTEGVYAKRSTELDNAHIADGLRAREDRRRPRKNERRRKGTRAKATEKKRQICADYDALAAVTPDLPSLRYAKDTYKCWKLGQDRVRQIVDEHVASKASAAR